MLIINQRREVEVMSNLMRKTLSTLKNEGVVSLTNKTYNYIKYRVTNKYRYYYNDILIINGCTLPHPQRYRVTTKLSNY